MRRLKEYVDNYGSVMSDSEIIYKYIIDNNLEISMIDMISNLAERKAEKIQDQLDFARAWIPNMATPVTKNWERYEEETESNLIKIIQCYLLGIELPSGLREWAKENIPKIETPFVFFLPAKEWLESTYGIYFKGEKV